MIEYENLKVGMEVKSQKMHYTVVKGNLDFLSLPNIEIPEGVHGEIIFKTQKQLDDDEFHVKWIEIEATTIENWNGFTKENLEVIE